MKKNKIGNKGFAITTMLYGLLIIAILVIFMLLSLVSFNKKSTNDFVKGVENELNAFANSTNKLMCAADGTPITVEYGRPYQMFGTTFYLLEDNGETIDLISGENLATARTYKEAMKMFESYHTIINDAKILAFKLPTAQQIANAANISGWLYSNSTVNDWSYLGVRSTTDQSKKANYSWLYSNGGYWTSDPVFNTYANDWAVSSNGALVAASTKDSTNYGVRIVITIPKDPNANDIEIPSKSNLPSETSKPVKIVSGDKNTVGSIAKIGDEEFYVIGSESGYTKLLTKYCLKDNNQVSSGAPTMKFSEKNYWKNKVGKDLQYPGTVDSSKITYYAEPYPYVYDSNSDLYSIINAYVDKIKKQGISKVTGRLMSYEEASIAPTDIIFKYDYWLGTAESEYYVYSAAYNFRLINYFSSSSVRPVILVPTNQIG